MKEKILIVEDEKDIRYIIKEALERENYSVLEAEDAEAGFGIAKHELPDLIILDVVLPDSAYDGFELAKKLKKESLTQDIPIIFLSIRDRKIDMLEGYKSGAIDYIVKPITTPDVLVKRVKEVLEGKISQDEVEKKKKRLETEIKIFPSS